MKSLWILNLRYLKRHKSFFFKSIVSIALLVCGVFLSLAVRGSYLFRIENDLASKYGRHSSTVYNADLSAIEDNRELMRETGDGLLYISYPLHMDGVDAEGLSYIGYMDKEALYLKPPYLLRGRMPGAPGEIALEEKIYYQLELEAEIGDTITLPLSVDGAAQPREYVLSGVLRNFTEDWLLGSRQFLGEGEAPSSLKIPGALLYEPPEKEEVLAANVLQAPDSGLDYGGFAVGGDASLAAWLIQQETGTINGFSLAFIAVLLGIMVLIINNIIDTDIKNRRRYLVTLKCVGLSPRQAAWMFRLQAFLLWAVSALAGLAAGFLFILIFMGFGDFSSFFSRSPGSFLFMILFSLLLSGAALLFSFRLKTGFIARKRPVEVRAEMDQKGKKHRFSSNFPELWSRSAGKSRRSQNVLYGVFTCILAFFTVFGSFFSVFVPRERFAYSTEHDWEDYQLSISGGKSSQETFQIIFPLKQGATKENVDKLKEGNLFDITFIGCNDMAKFFRKVSKEQVNQYGDPNFMGEEYRRLLLSYIHEEEVSDIVECPIAGIDEIMLDTLDSYVVEGEIDREKFRKGEILIAGGEQWELGEVVSILMPVLPEGSTPEKINGEPKIMTRDVPVGAVLRLPEEKRQAPSGYYLRDRLFFSIDVMMEENPNVRYDYISANLKEGVSQEEGSRLFKLALSKAYGCFLTDMFQVREEYAAAQRQWMELLLLLLGITACIASVCMYIVVASKMKNSLHSYALLRTVGITKKEVFSLLLYDSLRLTFIGFFIGGLLGLLIDMQYQGSYSWVRTGDIYLTAVLPVFCAVLLVFVLFQVIACRRVAEGLFRQSAVEAVRDITY